MSVRGPVLVGCCTLQCMLAAQSFVNNYGGPLAQDGVGTVQTSVGLVAGVRDLNDDPPLHTATFLRTTGGGTIQSWSPMVDLQGNVFLQCMAPTPTDGWFAAGSSIAPDSSDHDAFVAKYEADGSTAWIAQTSLAGSEQYFAVASMPDGGAVACGVRTIGNGHDAWISRIAADGNVLWNTAVDVGNDEEAYAITVDADAILMAGRQLNFSGTTDAWVARMDFAGNVLWTSAWGGDRNEVGRGIASLASGVFVVAGTSNSYGMRDTTESRIKDHVYLIAMDLGGDTLWTRAIGDTLFDHRALCMAVADNGDLLVAGERAAVTGESDALVYRITSTGTVLWERAWHVGKEDRLLAILALPDGFIGTGWAFTELARQVLLLRRDPNGN